MATNPYAAIALKDEENPYAKIAVSSPSVTTTPPTEPSLMQRGGKMLGDVYTGATQGLESTLGGLGNLITRPFVSPEFAARQKAYLKATTTPENTPQTIGKGLEQAGEFLVPGGAEEKLAGYAAKVPELARFMPAVRTGISALSSGLVNKLQGGNFGTGALAGGAGSAAGEALRAGAPAMAETALHVTKPMRAHGREIGKAALEYTRGIRPETIERTAGESIKGLESNALNRIPAGQTMSLAPVRQSVRTAMEQGPEAENVPSVIEAGRGLEDLLHRRYATNQPISENIGPQEALNLRRGIGKFLPQGTWNPETSSRIAPLRNKAYSAMNEQIGQSFPSIREADKPISSLIPVSRQAESISRGAPIGQRVLGRFGAHTGALTLGTAGAYGGYREGGLPGAVIGGIGGVIAPELISSPEGQMALARGMYRARSLRPVVGLGLQANRKEGEQ